MKQRDIPIVYASDESFLKQTYISIYSVLANRAEAYNIKFYILVPERCEEKKYNERWKFSNYTIEYIFVSEQYFQDTRMVISHISKPTYYRLLIPKLLPQYEKCLYLDGDTVCLGNIKELYEIDIKDNLLGASMGAVIPFNKTIFEDALNLPDATYYVNAGVLIMNLSLLRSENKSEEFLRVSEKEFPCQDQDVLNICCYGRIHLLPLKHNIYSVAFNMSEEMLLERYCRSEIREALNEPMIIHYPGEYAKPWNNLQCVKSDEWWKYAKQVLNESVICEMRRKAEEKMHCHRYDILFEKIKNSGQLVVFGYSEIGQKFCDQIDEKYPGRMVCFCDNAKEKWGLQYKQYSVLNLPELKERYPEALIVITSQRFSNIIQKQLLQEEIDLSQILIYRMKSMNFIYSMKKAFWEDVKQDIILDDLSREKCCL